MTYGGLEAGGTKFVCVLGTGPDDVLATERIEVTTPAETLPRAVAFFRRAVESGVRLDAIGIGSFGPLELRREHPGYGRIVATPKPGWSGADVLGPFRDAFGVPVGFDTDVNAAVLAEWRWGAARGTRSAIYLTLGTGIGGGAIFDGELVHGLGHPEMGHIAVTRHPDDDFAGSCPFHGACFEGMAAGPALQGRFGRRGEMLDGADLERAAELVGHYLGSGVRSLVYALAPERIVVGGGVASLPDLLPRARRALATELNGYPGLGEHAAASFLVPAALGSMAGPAGALALAEAAHRSASVARAG